MQDIKDIILKRVERGIELLKATVIPKIEDLDKKVCARMNSDFMKLENQVNSNAVQTFNLIT